MSLADRTNPEPRVWALEIPNQPYSTPNSREHWARKARKARDWRHATAMIARARKVPPCRRIRVALDLWPHDRRRRDADNLLLVLKWCLDGLRDAGVIEDDTSEYVTFSAPTIHEPLPSRIVTWVLTVEEIA